MQGVFPPGWDKVDKEFPGYVPDEVLLGYVLDEVFLGYVPDPQS